MVIKMRREERPVGRATPADFAGADAELAETLDNMDDAANYAAWIFALMAPHLGPELAEVGAGHGTFTELLAPEARRLVASDLSDRCAGILAERFADRPQVEILAGTLAAAAERGPFDAVILINVLEHIEDDEGALKEIESMLKPGGRVILWVPAFRLLYSDFDRRIGHYRRYRTAGLAARLRAAGFAVTDARYVNPVGGLAWLVLARLLHRTPTSGAPVAIFDKYFVPVLRRVEEHWRPPFGQSVFAVGTRSPD
jgi:2-polyprenyl-3-methyl-5-hydroxy-6-metoxy-1,4-benzoquinol methylase